MKRGACGGIRDEAVRRSGVGGVLQGSDKVHGKRANGCRSHTLVRLVLFVNNQRLELFVRQPQSEYLSKMSDSENDAGVPLMEPLSDSDAPAPTKANKRKRDADGKKSAKRRKLKKPKDVEDDALDAELGVNHALGHMDSSLMADHIAQRTRRFRPKLSVVEVEDFHLPGAHSSIRNRVARRLTTHYSKDNR